MYHTQLSSYKFKANPINPDIVNKAGLYGVPRKIASTTTIPHSPMLTTNKRTLEKNEEVENVNSREVEPNFQAKPMPNFEKILVCIKFCPLLEINAVHTVMDDILYLHCGVWDQTLEHTQGFIQGIIGVYTPRI